MHTKNSWFKNATALAGVGVAAFSFLTFAPLASADIAPAGCLNNDFQVNLNKSTAVAYDETTPGGPTTITYSVSAGNPQDGAGKGCNVDNVTINVTDPHGTVHLIQSGGSYPIGTAVALLPTTVSYIANSGDIVSGKLTASVTATGALHDTPVGTDALNVGKSVSVTTIHPNTTVTVTSSASAVEGGGTVNLIVSEKNTGDDPFASSSVSVTLTPPGTVLTKGSGSFTGGDTNTNDFLDPGETWTWTINGVAVTTGTTYTAVGTATDDMGNPVTFPAFPNEKATTTVNVVDANIQITPASDTDPINDNHVLTAHVNVNGGSGFVNAPSGTVISFAIASGPGTLASTSCLTVAATGSCTDTLTSPTVGTTVVNATTDVVVGGVTLHRTTNGLGNNSGSATKNWVSFTANMTTSIHLGATDSGAPIVVGTSTPTGGTVHDSAAVVASGTGPTPTGNVTFTFYTGAGSSVCDATSVGAGTVALNGSGVADPSAAQGPLAAGTYAFRAHYAGDANYPNGATSACEPFTVTPKTPSISTTLSSSTASIGASIHDSATLNGATANAGGTVTYNVYTDTACTLNGQSAGTKTVTSSTVPDSDPIAFNTPGDFYWQATYSGDANNTGPVKSTCTDEHLVIGKNHPTVATLLSSSSIKFGTAVTDSATLSGATSDAGGTATYSVYAGNVCTGTPVASSTVTVSSGAIANSTAFTAASAGTFNWQIVYSGDAKNAGATSACQTEVLTVVQPAIQYCSPGYWKQSQHYHSYVTYHPTDLFDTVFGVAAFPGKTLVDVLSTGGGGLTAFGRAAVGALLNSSALTTAMTPAQVIAYFDTTFNNAPGGNSNGYYGNASGAYTAPESCPLN